jgi:hypothetical protein
LHPKSDVCDCLLRRSDGATQPYHDDHHCNAPQASNPRLGIFAL